MNLFNFFIQMFVMTVRMLFISFIVFNIIDDFNIAVLKGYDMFKIFAFAMIIRLITSKIEPKQRISEEDFYTIVGVDFIALIITWGMIYIVHLIQL